MIAMNKGGQNGTLRQSKKIKSKKIIPYSDRIVNN
jgi:hypothetical protein